MLKGELIGNLGADAEVKVADGNKFVTMRVAHSEKQKKEDGTEVSYTSWVDVTWNKTDSPLLPYLKAGVKVFIRGYLSTRVYSSKKDRQMKAGLKLAVSEIELCGGSSDAVPRELIDPETAATIQVSKWYWADFDTKGMKKDDLKLWVDRQGREYGMNKQGFILPRPEDTEEQVQEDGQ